MRTNARRILGLVSRIEQQPKVRARAASISVRFYEGIAVTLLPLCRSQYSSRDECPKMIADAWWYGASADEQSQFQIVVQGALRQVRATHEGCDFVGDDSLRMQGRRNAIGFSDRLARCRSEHVGELIRTPSRR